MKYGQNLKLGDAHRTPRNIQEVQASKLGNARASSSSSTKYQVIFQCAIFLLLHMLCVVLGASSFLFLVQFCFVCCNQLGCILAFLCGREIHSVLIAQNTLVFTLIVQRAFYFCEYYVQLQFLPLLCSELFSSLQLGLISSLIFINFHLFKLFQIS